MNLTKRWHEEIIKNIEPRNELCERIRNLLSCLEDDINDAVSEINANEDAQDHIHDVKKGIFLPIWNRLSEVTPDDLESYCDNDFLVYSQPFCFIYSWNKETKCFRSFNNELDEWVDLNMHNQNEWFWIPCTPPTLY